MVMKETPLLNASGQGGPIPLPSGAFLSGFCAAFMCGVFGAVAMFFQVFARAPGMDISVLYRPVSIGAIIGMWLAAAMAPLGALAGAAGPGVIARFFLGAVLCAAPFTLVNLMFAEAITEWLMGVGIKTTGAY